MATALATTPPVFERAYMISDMHLGGVPGRQMFGSGAQFKTLIAHVIEETERLRRRKKSARVLLVINGDFVDFLAEPGATAFNPERAPRMLLDILDRGSFRPIRQGLQTLVATEGTHLVLVLGNHDIELALPDTRRTLVKLLTKDKPEREGKLEFCFDGWGYRFQVGGKRALCLHGNETDGYNFTRYDELDRILHDLQIFGHSEFGADWCPSAGSRFVVEAINPIKNRFPFIDLLKPEIPLAASLLGMLDPSKITFVDDAARLKARALYNERIRPSSQRRMLSTEPLATTPGDGESFAIAGSAGGGLSRSLTATEIETRSERALAANEIDELIAMSPEAELLGTPWWLQSLHDAARSLRDEAIDLTTRLVSDLTGGARDKHMRMVRAAIRRLVNDDSLTATQLSQKDLALDASVRAGYDVVFAGHTHFRRLAPRPRNRGWHVNTGCWADLIFLTREDVESREFDQIYDALRSDDRRDLHRVGLVRQDCTVAEMASEGKRVIVSLGEVSKSSFEPRSVRSTPV